jgi:glycosyltransferase involved in cell wall biosynthesis
MAGNARPRPKVSVLMIAYNVEPYIAQALDSALMQDVDFDYEIVVGEDCSTDGTRAIVQDYARRHPDRIRLLTRERNLGMNRNFVETLRAVRGEFVALLDGDDYWTSPTKLRRQVDFLESNPGFSICFHNAEVIYEDGSLAPHPFHMPNPDRLISHHVPKPVSTLADLAGGNFMQTCSVVFRAGLYGELPAGSFWSTNMALYRRVEDVDAMIRAYRIVNRYTGYRYDPVVRGQLEPLYGHGLRAAVESRRYGRAAGFLFQRWRARASRALRRQ